MNIVTFYTSSPTWAIHPHRLAGIKKPPSDRELGAFLRATLRIVPEAALYAITDSMTATPPPIEAVRTVFRQTELMLERARGQRRLLEQLPGLTALWDTDVLAVKRVGDVCDGSWDVAVTVRHEPRFAFEKRMPYNNGVMFANALRRDRVRSFFDALIARTEQMDPSYRAWAGNQLAVLDLLGRRSPGELVTVAGARVRILDCDEFNYAPRGPNEDLGGRRLLHFRGEAKRLLAQYERRLSS